MPKYNLESKLNIIEKNRKKEFFYNMQSNLFKISFKNRINNLTNKRKSKFRNNLKNLNY